MKKSKIIPSDDAIEKLYFSAHNTELMQIMAKHFNKYL